LDIYKRELFFRIYMNSINNRDIEIHPDKTIITLYESNIPIETIALQPDLSITEVIEKIKEHNAISNDKEESIIRVSKVPKLGMLLIDTIFDTESAIKDA